MNESSKEKQTISDELFMWLIKKTAISKGLNPETLEITFVEKNG